MTPDPDTLLEALCGHLRSELELHRALLRIAEHKHRDIVGGDMEAFTRDLEQEQLHVQQGAGLNQQRRRLLQRLARQFNLDARSIQMQHILEHCGEPLRGELQQLRQDLRKVLERLRSLNERNLLLIRQSLGFVKELINLAVGHQESGAYTHGGGYDDRRRAGGLLNLKA